MRRISVAVVLIVSLALPATALAAPARWGGVWHQVQRGQTLFSIGRWYGVSPYAIAAANSLANWNVIYAGQWLWIPSGGYSPGPYPGCARNHYVSPGETLLGIGRWYGVSAWSIAAANRIYNLNQIYAGQWLCIP
jgi:LysM repeat protein